MNGNKRYLLDTNAVIGLLSGNQELARFLSHADWIGISVITKLEFLCFNSLTPEDRDLFNSFTNEVYVLGIGNHDDFFHEKITAYRSNKKLKLPDAIIAATASIANAALITNDHLLDAIEDLQVIRF